MKNTADSNTWGRRVAAKLGFVAARLAPVVVLLATWEIFARSGAVTPFMLPALSDVAGRIIDDAELTAACRGTIARASTVPEVVKTLYSCLLEDELFINIGVTLWRAFTGFIIAAAAGIVLGAAMARNAVARWFFDPIISVGFPMPKIAFLPIVMLWLGLHDVSKITMVVLDAIFPVVTATVVGIAGVEKELLWSARNMGATKRQLLWQILLPAALPQIFTGLQVALPIALIVVVVVEMQMGGYGIGGAMREAAGKSEAPGIFAGIVEIAVIGYALVAAMAWLRRRLLRWHPEAQGTTDVLS
jgi:ABC-type nitrate/sulfonate/bicarbonate transport system permease component